jgi:3-oxoacyl-[acyl-carrier-protein] synthase II
VKGNTDILSRMDMIVAAGGARDLTVDRTSSRASSTQQIDAFLNERLMSDLRPTLFLAQLQPSRRKHLDRSWCNRLFANVYGRRVRGTIDAVRIARAQYRRLTSDTLLWSADRTMGNVRIC